MHIDITMVNITIMIFSDNRDFIFTGRSLWIIMFFWQWITLKDNRINKTAFSDPQPFQTLSLFRPSAFSNPQPFQTVSLFKPSTFSHPNGLSLFKPSAFSNPRTFQTLGLFRPSAFSNPLPFQTLSLFKPSAQHLTCERAYSG